MRVSLCVPQPVLDMPEQLWKAYIDTEIEQQAYDNVRDLYRSLLDRTQHVKVWVSYAQFEASIKDADRARSVFKEAYAAMKTAKLTVRGCVDYARRMVWVWRLTRVVPTGGARDGS